MLLTGLPAMPCDQLSSQLQVSAPFPEDLLQCSLAGHCQAFPENMGPVLATWMLAPGSGQLRLAGRDSHPSRCHCLRKKDAQSPGSEISPTTPCPTEGAFEKSPFLGHGAGGKEPGRGAHLWQEPLKEEPRGRLGPSCCTVTTAAALGTRSRVGFTDVCVRMKLLASGLPGMNVDPSTVLPTAPRLP